MTPSDPPQVHGDGLTPPSEGAGASEAQSDAERLNLAALIAHPKMDNPRWMDTDACDRCTYSLDAADAILTAGFAKTPQPELITMPTFKGCTNANPDLCACNEGAVCCDACGGEVDDGAEVWTVSVPSYPWMGLEAEGQEYEDYLWHTHCDLRGSGG